MRRRSVDYHNREFGLDVSAVTAEMGGPAVLNRTALRSGAVPRRKQICGRAQISCILAGAGVRSPRLAYHVRSLLL